MVMFDNMIDKIQTKIWILKLKLKRKMCRHVFLDLITSYYDGANGIKVRDKICKKCGYMISRVNFTLPNHGRGKRTKKWKNSPNPLNIPRKPHQKEWEIVFKDKFKKL